MEALLLVAERGGPTMFARIGVMRALCRSYRVNCRMDSNSRRTDASRLDMALRTRVTQNKSCATEAEHPQGREVRRTYDPEAVLTGRTRAPARVSPVGTSRNVAAPQESVAIGVWQTWPDQPSARPGRR
jgi:hypothetical protein